MVAVGKSTTDPFTATGVPFKVTEVALVVTHVKVVCPQLRMLVGDAVNEAVGIGGGGGGGLVTVTVVLAVAEPVALVATSLYVVVAVGEYACDPLRATGLPFIVTESAFVVTHVNVVCCPLSMLAGDAVKVAVGIGVGGGGVGVVTVTVAVAVVEPAALVATSV